MSERIPCFLVLNIYRNKQNRGRGKKLLIHHFLQIKRYQSLKAISQINNNDVVVKLRLEDVINKMKHELEEVNVVSKK